MSQTRQLEVLRQKRREGKFPSVNTEMTAVHTLVPFKTWADLISAARAGTPLYYGAPLDIAASYPYRRVAVLKVYKNGKIRIDPMTSGADHFTADSGHLLRFRFRAHGVGS